LLDIEKQDYIKPIRYNTQEVKDEFTTLRMDDFLNTDIEVSNNI
jgi:hypothetical protein